MPSVSFIVNLVPASMAAFALAYAGDASPFAAMSSATAFCSSKVQSFASLAMAAWTVAESAPVEPPPDAPPPSVPALAPLFTVLPTRLNWLRMAPATSGPANTITRPMTAMIRTYSMIDCPRRRVPQGDTPPRRLIAAACIYGSLRSGFAIRAERRAIPKFCSGLAAAAIIEVTF